MNRNSLMHDVSREIESEIWDIYSKKKQEILNFYNRGDAETVLEQIYDIWMFMNRFRNCSLKFYFDEELHSVISGLNKQHYDTSHLLQPKKDFKIAFVFNVFNDTGGAAFTHRYILEDYLGSNYSFKQYILVTNSRNEAEYKNKERYKYMQNRIKFEEFHFMEPNDSLLEKGKFIQQWLFERQIDFAVIQPDPCTLYALASRPVLIDATFSADWHTFTLGPGRGDFTFLMTTDQVFKYSFSEPYFERRLKNVKLPLPPLEYVNRATALAKSELSLPEEAVVSATTNLWKCCFGDDEVLLEGIAALIRKFPNYHHIFVGTPRCLDNVEFFLNKNPDIKNNIHFIGPVPYIYRLLKAIDFYINSYPVSGASNTEAAICGKPSIDLFANRDLAGHSCELLRSFECEVISLDEFVELGTRFISDPEYRKDLGGYLREKMIRELGKQRVAKKKIYDMFISEFQRRLTGREKMQGLNLTRTISYEKGIALYNAYGKNNWSLEKRRIFLDYCVENFSERPFGWIKSLEEAIRISNQQWFNMILKKIPEDILKDYRIHVMLALGFNHFCEYESSINHALEAVRLATYDIIPRRVAAKLLFNQHRLEEAAQVYSVDTGENITAETIGAVLEKLPVDNLPIYYNY